VRRVIGVVGTRHEPIETLHPAHAGRGRRLSA
jgi:hypothetical protein